MKTRYVD